MERNEAIENDEIRDEQSLYHDILYKIASVLSKHEDKEDSPLEQIRAIMVDGFICCDFERSQKTK